MWAVGGEAATVVTVSVVCAISVRSIDSGSNRAESVESAGVVVKPSVIVPLYAWFDSSVSGYVYVRAGTIGKVFKRCSVVMTKSPRCALHGRLSGSKGCNSSRVTSCRYSLPSV